MLQISNAHNTTVIFNMINNSLLMTEISELTCRLFVLYYVYGHTASLTYRQSYKMSGWMKHKMESRFPGEISIVSDM